MPSAASSRQRFALLGAGLEQAEVERWFALDLCDERVD
jgi:L-asparaginase